VGNSVLDFSRGYKVSHHFLSRNKDYDIPKQAVNDYKQYSIHQHFSDSTIFTTKFKRTFNHKVLHLIDKFRYFALSNTFV
jgi:hypothetical protein